MRALLVVAMVALGGCVVPFVDGPSLPDLRADLEALRAELHGARGGGAVSCAPEALADAQVAWRFARIEAERGDVEATLDYIAQAEQALQRVRGTAGCWSDAAAQQAGEADPWLDPDADGVTEDRCPYEAEDADGWQDEDGCPDPDNDGDGLLDAADGCPLVAEDLDGYEDFDGCPEYDNDGDGVPDDQDTCPTTAETTNDWADDDGCPDLAPLRRFDIVDRRLVFKEPITFVHKGSQLSTASMPALDELAEQLRWWSDWFINIEGHTDNRGVDIFLQRTSEERAAAVKAYLVEAGVAENRISTVGYGASAPITTNRTQAGRDANNRVVIEIVKGENVEYAATLTYDVLVLGKEAPAPQPDGAP